MTSYANGISFGGDALGSLYYGDQLLTKVADCEDTIFAPEEQPFTVDVLIVGGGGGGGTALGGGGGGAGGYREFTKKYYTGTSYTVTVGAGGSASSTGSDSSIERIGSGGGAGGVTTGGNGGSGGGGNGFFSGAGGSSTSPRCNGSSQGNAGDTGNGIFAQGGGGGGAAAAGSGAGNGGNGTASSITGSSVTRAGGGGGGDTSGGFGSTATPGSGGSGGGGDGGSGNQTNDSAAAAGDNGTANTGGGGGGGAYYKDSPAGSNLNGTGGNGGSGFVVIKFPDTYTITIGGGLTSSSSTSGGYTTVQFTAGTDTISFAAVSSSQEYTDSLLLYPFDSDANDASSTGNDLTLTNASIDTSVKKYGAGSLKFTGSLSNGKAQGTMPALSTGNFTVEFWIYMASSTNNQYIIDRGQGSNFYYDNPGWVLLTSAGKFQWVIKDSYDSGENAYSASLFLNSTTTVLSSVGSWVHIALVRQGTTYRLYIDGTQEASSTGSATDFVEHNFAIGDAMVNGAGVAQNTYVDDFRLSSTAVYPDGTTFTVPSAAHPTS